MKKVILNGGPFDAVQVRVPKDCKQTQIANTFKEKQWALYHEVEYQDASSKWSRFEFLKLCDSNGN